jgi:hypothetical protein
MPFRDRRLSNAGLGDPRLTGGSASGYAAEAQQSVSPLVGFGSESDGTVLIDIRFRIKGKDKLTEMQLFMRR